MPIPITIQIPGLIQPDLHCRNGFYPDALFYAQAASALNHSIAYRHREVARREWDLGYGARSSGATTIARFRFRSGYGATRLRLQGIMGLSHTSATAPYLKITVTKGATTQVKEIHYGMTNMAPTDAPDEWSLFDEEIAIDPASVYTIDLEANNYARPLSFTAHELGPAAVDDATSYFTEHDPQGGNPILDADQQKLIEGPANMLRQNGGTLVHWGLHEGNARTRTSATPISLIDNTSASPPTSTSPGYRLVTTARNTYSATTVPIELAVWGSKASGSGTVRLRDTSGTDAVTVTINSATPQWFTATGSISVGTGEKYDLMFAGDGGGDAVNVNFVSFYEYQP